MSDPLSAGEPQAGDTTAQLRHDIDCGLTGDKAGGFDPAAAPLGVDDEAAGYPPAPGVVAEARRQERRLAGDSACANAATPELAPNAVLPPQPGLIVVAAAGVAAGVALGALVFAAL